MPCSYCTLAPLMRLSLELERAGWTIGYDGGAIEEALAVVRTHLDAGFADGQRQRAADCAAEPEDLMAGEEMMPVAVAEFTTDTGRVCRVLDEVSLAP